jgi:hypothetical protein
MTLLKIKVCGRFRQLKKGKIFWKTSIFFELPEIFAQRISNGGCAVGIYFRNFS